MQRFLIADDSPTVCIAAARAVRNACHNYADVHEVTESKDILPGFDALDPHLLFLDIVWAGKNAGMDALRTILRAKPDARVVIMTGLSRDSPEVQEALMLGAFAYLEKPVRTEEVERIISQVRVEDGWMTRIP